MGDPAGISPELAAKLLASDDLRAAAQMVVFGDRRILQGGADVAGVILDLDVVSADRVPASADRLTCANSTARYEPYPCTTSGAKAAMRSAVVSTRSSTDRYCRSMRTPFGWTV